MTASLPPFLPSLWCRWWTRLHQRKIKKFQLSKCHSARPRDSTRNSHCSDCVKVFLDPGDAPWGSETDGPGLDERIKRTFSQKQWTKSHREWLFLLGREYRACGRRAGMEKPTIKFRCSWEQQWLFHTTISESWYYTQTKTEQRFATAFFKRPLMCVCVVMCQQSIIILPHWFLVCSYVNMCATLTSQSYSYTSIHLTLFSTWFHYTAMFILLTTMMLSILATVRTLGVRTIIVKPV